MVLYCQSCTGPKKRVFRVQLDDCGWQQDECKLQNGQNNGHAVRYLGDIKLTKKTEMRLMFISHQIAIPETVS